MVHEGRLRAEVREGRIVFFDQDERALPNVPPTAKGWDLEELELYLREIDVQVDEYTAAGKWDGSSVDVGEVLDWVLIAEQGRPPAPSQAA
ncbi:MAG: hypothetical protein R6X02_04430 [Enhygromyxa sp.]